MRILDRYIIKPVIRTLLGCLALFCLLYIIIDIFNHLDEILKQKISYSILTDYYLAYLPMIFVQVTPFACLISILYVIGNLSRHNEIIAMRASGISTFKIVRGIVILGILMSMFVFWVNEKFLASSSEIFDNIKTNILKDTKKEPPKELTNLCIYGTENRIFFINRFFLANNTLEGITILQEDRNYNIIQKILANRGVWQNNRWLFSEIIIYNFNANGHLTENVEYYPLGSMNISETPQDFLRQKKDPRMMSISQLKKYIDRFISSSAHGIARSFKVDFYHRLFFPFTSLVITIIGIPFAIRIKGRMSTFSSFGISLIIGFLYYVIDSISLALGKNGILPPILGAGFTPVFFLVLGIYLISRF